MGGDGYTARLAPKWRRLLVVGSVAVSLPMLSFQPAALGAAGARIVAVGLMAVQAAALFWLDARPRASAAIVLAAGAGFQVLFPAFGPGVAFVVLCTYAWMRPAAESLWMLGLAAVAVSGPALVQQRWLPAGLWLVACLLAWSWGAQARARGARRVAERRRAVLEERARIARELHDVLSHTVSVMVVQAAAADDVFEVNPAKAREALRRTEQAGRQALAELRWFLRTVRDEDGAEGSPQPSLDDLERLAESVRGAGLAVEVVREGSGPVPAAVQLGAYRIVQEALTNALRHAQGSKAIVRVRIDGEALVVQVRDDGDAGASPSANPGSGHGLAGMRERASLLGGAFSAGPHPDGGFRVEARLPVGEAPGGAA
ncbi:sensor histidine kinase [Dactylosporangium sp. CA-052675]|uniref:sensor histidine kinase n=1 Tax=Dactylosporangium sp. CA-052675 TaxID=3239927 RepID=UPI003D8C7C6D